MKNANGYGCIRKLPGKRRNPWAVIRTTGWTASGKQLRTYLGYYRTRQDAVKALADYNDNPYDVSGFTFAEIFAKWSAYKYPTISRSNQSGYNAAYNKCEKLHDMKIQSIRFDDLQSCLDPLNAPSAKKMKILFSQMWEYAERRNLIAKNFTNLLDTKPIEKSVLHMKFSDDELTVLWERSDDDYVAVILMMIYSGVRPGELLALKTRDVDLEKRCFSIRAGKNRNAIRDVPIHFRTLPFFERWYDRGKEYLVTTESGKPFDFQRDHKTYNNVYFSDVLRGCGILYQDGKKHHPDDVRHTFTSLWTVKKLSEIYRRRIQGHSGNGVGEDVYTHLTLDELAEELNKL